MLVRGTFLVSFLKLRGIRLRLTLVYSTLFGLSIVLFAWMITDQHFKSTRNDFDSGLINYAIDLSEYLRFDNKDTLTFQLPESEIKKVFPFVLKETIYVVRSIDGTILSRSFSTDTPTEIPYDPSLPLKERYTHRLLTFEQNGSIYRAVNMKMSTKDHGDLILQVATVYNSVLDREQALLIITGSLVPLLILISSFLSFILAGKALSPITILSNTASKIAASNLSERIPVFTTKDEVEELSKSLNLLLDRLEVSFEAQENFVANASHQLNTPLSIIKGELDVLESKYRSPEEIKRFHASLREEVTRLIDLVKNMLLVSRVKSGLEKFIFHPLRLDDLLITIVSRMNVRAKEKRIVIRYDIEETLTEKNLIVMGERQLLDSLFENILDNAIKYSPEESTVQIAIKKQSEKTEIWIQDEGPGMSEEVKNKLGTRFQRGQANLMPGTGIGLSIAKKIAEFHGAEIDYRPEQPRGSLFIVRFGPQST